METTTFTILTDADYNKRAGESGFSADKYVKLSDLAKLGLTTEGFYYSYTCNAEHCAMCGLNMHRYYYLTYTKAEGCKYHVVYIYDYKGNVDFEGFEYTAEMLTVGHRTVESGNTDYSNVNDGVTEVRSYIGNAEIPFTPTTAHYNEEKCIACGMLFKKHIYLKHGVDDDYCTLTLRYNEGKVSTWTFWYEYNFDTAIDRIKKYYGLELDCEKDLKQQWGNCYYSINSDGEVHECMELTGTDAEDNQYGHEVWFKLNRSGDDLTVYVYYVSKCVETTIRYIQVNGVWTLNRASDMAHHSKLEAYGENCREDGKFCTICGNRENIFPEHDFGSDDYYWNYGWVQSNLAVGDISSLDASIDHGHDCHDCQTYIGVTIVLRSDWTLTSDVYFKAENITLDINGHNINLNGHSLAIYGYAGSSVVITDSKFDTSAPSSNNAKIYNSASSGILVVASDSNMGPADIVAGTVVIDCTKFVSDDDNRHSLYNSLKAEGYNLEILKTYLN